MFAGQVDRRGIVAARHIGGGASIQYGNIFVFEYGSRVISCYRHIVIALSIYRQRGKMRTIIRTKVKSWVHTIFCLLYLVVPTIPEGRQGRDGDRVVAAIGDR